MDDADFTQALAVARLRRLRPLCTCQPEGVEMYVAAAGDRFVVKRMPYSASRHSAACRHSREVPLQIRVGRPGLKDGAREHIRFERRCQEFDELLHELWERAGLTYWHPRFAGKRNWRTIRHRLADAATGVQWGDARLSSSLYIPEPYRSANAEAIEERRRSRWAAIARDFGPPNLILIGEVKHISHSGTPCACTIKHLPLQPFAMSVLTYAHMTHAFATEIALWAAAPESHLLSIAAVDVSTPDRPIIGPLALMIVSGEWLPANDAPGLAAVQRMARTMDA